MVTAVGWDGRIRIPIEPDVHKLLRYYRDFYDYRSYSEVLRDALYALYFFIKECDGNRSCVSLTVRKYSSTEVP